MIIIKKTLVGPLNGFLFGWKIWFYVKRSWKVAGVSLNAYDNHIVVSLYRVI